MTLKRLLSQKRASGNTFIGVTALPVLPPAFIFYFLAEKCTFLVVYLCLFTQSTYTTELSTNTKPNQKTDYFGIFVNFLTF